jgi:hypothetical protein
VLIAAFGGPEFRLREAALLGVGLAVGCSAAFIWGLGLPMQACPS